MPCQNTPVILAAGDSLHSFELARMQAMVYEGAFTLLAAPGALESQSLTDRASDLIRVQVERARDLKITNEYELPRSQAR